MNTSKLNTYAQEATPLSAKMATILDADNRIQAYHTEFDNVGRVIVVELASGFNYESRSSIHAGNITELKQMLKNVQVGCAKE